MENRYLVNLDFKQRSFLSISFVQNNMDTGVLEFTITNGGQPVSIAGQTIEIAFSKPDGTFVIQDSTTGVTILDGGTTGKLECVLKSNTLAAVGTVKAEISFSEAGKKLSTAQFSFNVTATLETDEAVMSTNEIPILDAKIAEATDKIAETETARQLAIQATNDADAATSTAIAGEADRVISEDGRVTSENGRVSAEGSRVTAESSRITSEDGRVTAETERVSAETTRVGNENTRLAAETIRVSSESDRVTAEETRAANELTRQSQETARQDRDTAFSLLEAYDNAHAYVPLNKVTYLGSTYQCTVPCTGVLPTDPANWIMIAQKGADGSGVGDMLKSVYDVAGNGVVDDAEKLGGELPAYYAQQSALTIVSDDLIAHKAESATYDFQQFDKDATTGMYFRFEEYRVDSTLFRKTLLSNPDVNGYPQTETQTRYGDDGTAVLSTKTFALVFDADGLLVSRDEVV